MQSLVSLLVSHLFSPNPPCDSLYCSCHNDVLNMLEYIKKVHGFQDANITILMDDGQHTNPTHDNIVAAYDTLVKESQPGDAVFW